MSDLSSQSCRWRAPLWAWLLFLPVMLLLCSLGLWQLQRGETRQALDAQYASARAGLADAPVLQPADPPLAQGVRPVRVSGTWVPQRQLLLDNQSQRKRPGYHVWTPLRLAGGELLLVSRGWVAQHPDRRIKPELPPLAAAPVELRGYWRQLPQPGLRLAAPDVGCVVADNLQVVQYPDAQRLACLLQAPVLPGLLLLDPDAPDGFVRDWRIAAEVPPARHYAYAAQWFAFAATLLFLFIKLNFKSRS